MPGFDRKIYAVNFLLNFAVQGSLIFIPLLGAQLGGSDFQVGLIGSAYGSAFLISSLVSGWKSDTSGRVVFVRRGLLICCAAFAAQLLSFNLWLLMALRALVGFSLGITVAAAIAYAYEAGADMGVFSSYGSLGWIFGSMTAALLGDIHLLFVVSSAVCFLAFLMARGFSENPGARPAGQPSLWQVVVRNRRVYAAVFLRHLGATAVWIILPLYFASLGLNKFWIGFLWSINFAVQFVVMRGLEKFSPYKTFAFGQLLSLIVFVAYAFVAKLWPLIIAQALLGIAWSCLYVGALLIVLKSGEERGTASGIFQSTLNFCNAVGPLLGGIFAQLWGYRGVMLMAAALGAAGMLAAVPRTVPAEQGSAGKA